MRVGREEGQEIANHGYRRNIEEYRGKKITNHSDMRDSLSGSRGLFLDCPTTRPVRHSQHSYLGLTLENLSSMTKLRQSQNEFMPSDPGIRHIPGPGLEIYDLLRRNLKIQTMAC